MPERDVVICLSSNNEKFEENLLDNKPHPEVKFAKEKHNAPYRLFLIDLQNDLNHISQNLIDTYGTCREHGSKLVVIIIHEETIDIEKNHYFQKMLDDLGKDKPLHRLVFTKDVYQCSSSVPVTRFDQYLYTAMTERKMNISQKGESLLFPLSVEDLIAALLKTLFLSNTSGKSFWLLGDPLTDLELSYLIKRIISITGKDDLEINATKTNDPKTNSLISFGNKARAELSWQPEKEILDDLARIATLYGDKPDIEVVKQEKRNPIHKFLTWVYRPRQKKETQLPTLKKIGKKLLLAILTIYIFFALIAVLAIGLSLQQLEKSVDEALNGNLNQSTDSLNKATVLKEVGESSFAPLVTIGNIITPKGTEKIYNLFSFISYGVSSLENLHQTYVLAENLLLSLNNSNTEINYGDYSLALHSNLSQVYENLNQIDFLSSGNKLPKAIDNKIKANPKFKNLKNLEKQIIQFIKITDIIPKVLSTEKVNTILVLLQNSQVPRPSGGEVDYYLLLTINQGNLVSKKYYTEPELDSLYLNNTASDLKLNNLLQNPDFPILSNNLVTYFEKTLAIKLDFVIATNDLLIQELLFEEKSQEIDKFKTDIISASGSAIYKDLADQYLNRLFSQNLALPIIGRTLAKTIGDNQTLLWSADIDTEHLLALQSYSGAITPHPCNAGIAPVDKCIAQTSYLSESTFTNSRENPWSDRQVSHTINITSPSIQHEYRLDYKPKISATNEAIISTTYHLYISSPSTLDKILLNNLPASMKEVKKIVEGSFDHYEIPLSLNSNQNTTIVINTTTITDQSFSIPLSYSITEYRQPGTIDSGISLKIIYLENLRPTVVTSAFEAQPAQMMVKLPPHTSTFGFTLDQNSQ